MKNSFDNGFKLKIQCEQCGIVSDKQKIYKLSFYCPSCFEAQKRRKMLLKAEKEWGKFDRGEG